MLSQNHHENDILFIHPNASKIIYQDLAKNNSAIEPPIWAGVSEQHEGERAFSKILDAEVLGLITRVARKPRWEYAIVYQVHGQQPRVLRKIWRAL